MTEPSAWVRITQEDPGHSATYIQRFRDLAAQGIDLVGEARLIDAMLPRGASVLDAGCGPGRIGGHLASVGHDVVGVDRPGPAAGFRNPRQRLRWDRGLRQSRPGPDDRRRHQCSSR